MGDACDPDFPCNKPPDCSGATIADKVSDAASQAVISGADVTGVTDPDGDPLLILVNPSTLKLGTNTVLVTGDDGKGGICQISITVDVIDKTPLETGDLDGDGNCDRDDRNILRASLRKCEGTPGYNPECDYDGDGCITYGDYRIWYGYYRAAK
jgi:hypothetical protein